MIQRLLVDAVYGRRLVFAGMAIALLVLVLPAQAAPEAGTSSVTFRLISVPTSFRRLDGPPKGVLNKGDVLYVSSRLRNGYTQFGRPKGAVVGSDVWVLTALAKRGWSFVTARVKLPGGTLQLRGRLHTSQSIRVLPVVGGTGRFANARGTCEARERIGDAVNDYQLRLP